MFGMFSRRRKLNEDMFVVAQILVGASLRTNHILMRMNNTDEQLHGNLNAVLATMHERGFVAITQDVRRIQVANKSRPIRYNYYYLTEKGMRRFGIN